MDTNLFGIGLVFFITGCGALVLKQKRIELVIRCGELECHMEGMVSQVNTEAVCPYLTAEVYCSIMFWSSTVISWNWIPRVIF